MKTESLLVRVVLCALPAVCACGTVQVRVPVMKPAEINMAPYSSVAIGGVTGNANGPLSAGLEESLVASQRFSVVDRSHMDKVLSELQLSSTDLADPSKAAKLGKVVTAGAMIFGDATESYREDTSQDSSKDDKGNVTAIHKLHGELIERATFKVVDVSTGRLVIAKTYEERRDDTNRGYNKAPSPIDRASLEKQAREAVLARFMKAIVPHQEYMTANFQKDSDIPQLEGGIGWAERGDWKKAEDSFNQTVADSEKNLKLKPAQIGKAYWNLGLSYEYAGDYAKASDMINKAYTLSNDRDMLGELDNIKRLQDDAKRLAEQTSSTEAAGGK
jgi:tetratricopeptide (TPR) repeat protein